jgi:transglutaminase-like putative cysteine protease
MMNHWSQTKQKVPGNSDIVLVDRPQMKTVPYDNVSYIPGIIPPQTAQKMVQLALQAVVDPEVAGLARWLVKDLVDEVKHPFAAVYSEVQAIYHWVRNHVRYTRDPIGVELVYTPQQLVQLIQQYGSWSEDCDTQMLLIYTLLLAIGRRARITIAGFNDQQPGVYTHVFIEVLFPPVPGYTKARWVSIDPTTEGSTDSMLKKIKTKLHFSP